MRVVTMLPAEWDKYSQDAHAVCFGEVRPAGMNRIDFALTTIENDIPLSYMTCREVDSESIYMQYGGAFPSAKGSVKSFISYTMMINHLSTRYKRASTLISNTNHAMLKFAMKVGLEIIGVRLFKGEIFVEHLIEFGGVNG